MKSQLQTWFEFKHFAGKLDRQLEQALQELKPGLTLNEFYVLKCLAASAGEVLSVKTISQKIDLSQSATSRMLARFEKNCGVIKRTVSPDDKRSVVIELTPRGKEFLQDGMALIQPILANYADLLVSLEGIRPQDEQ